MRRRKNLTRSICALVFAGALLAANTASANLQERADRYFAEQRWDEASAAYSELHQEDASNPNNWFNLARALQESADYSAARSSFERALSTGYQPEARARFYLARVLMSLDEPGQALDQLEAMSWAGGPNFRVVQNTREFESLAGDPRFVAVIEALKPCNTPEHRQFDFWLGQWDVTPAGGDQTTAENDISAAQDGCIIVELYVHGFFTGMSMNLYDATTQSWHQTWMSNAGGALYLEGGINAAGAMEMSDHDLPISKVTGTVNRVTWAPNADGSVRQVWHNSTDRGQTWTIVFDGTYTKQMQ